MSRGRPAQPIAAGGSWAAEAMAAAGPLRLDRIGLGSAQVEAHGHSTAVLHSFIWFRDLLNLEDLWIYMVQRFIKEIVSSDSFITTKNVIKLDLVTKHCILL